MLDQALTIAAFLLLALVVVFLAKLLKDLTTSYRLDDELAKPDNAALALSFSGYLLATFAIFTGVLLGPSRGLMEDLATVGLYSLLGILLLNLARVFNDKVLFYRFSTTKEVITDRNAGTGAAQLGSYLGSGFIIAGAVHGQGGGILTALAFFAAGQIVFAIYTWIYNLITPYCIHDEIERDNVAAGVAYSGALIGIGIILMHASGGDFVSWGYNFSIFALEALAAIILLPLVRWGLDKVFIAHLDLNREIATNRSLGAAILEASSMVGFATVLSFLFY